MLARALLVMPERKSSCWCGASVSQLSGMISLSWYRSIQSETLRSGLLGHADQLGLLQGV